jgi:hypothetical protein
VQRQLALRGRACALFLDHDSPVCHSTELNVVARAESACESDMEWRGAAWRGGLGVRPERRRRGARPFRVAFAPRTRLADQADRLLRKARVAEEGWDDRPAALAARTVALEEEARGRDGPRARRRRRALPRGQCTHRGRDCDRHCACRVCARRNAERRRHWSRHVGPAQAHICAYAVHRSDSSHGPCLDGRRTTLSLRSRPRGMAWAGARRCRRRTVRGRAASLGDLHVPALGRASP